MSTQKGNCSRTRPQKHQNTKVYKNNLHDKSKKTKVINGLKIDNVCERCKGILEWKIKYKKYKQIKNPATCCKCNNKCVVHSYHTVCEACSRKLKICPKCGRTKEELAAEVLGAESECNEDSDSDISEQ